MSEFLATILSALTALWPGGDETSALIYNGYLEGDFVYLSAAAPGKLTEVRVAEGDVVEAGETLFLIENTHQINALAAAQARVAIAEANLENLQTGGRGAEIDVVRASLQQAEADQTLAATNAQRSAELFSRGLAPQAKVDAFAQANKQHMARDNDEDLVFLTRLQWDIDRVARDYPDVTLTATKEMMV